MTLLAIDPRGLGTAPASQCKSMNINGLKALNGGSHGIFGPLDYMLHNKDFQYADLR